VNFFLTVSMQDWIRTLVSAVLLGALVLAMESVRRYARGPVEFTRRLIHLVTGVLIFFAPLYLHSPVPALVLGGIFTVVNGIAVRRRWPASMHATERTTYGTVYYPLSFTVLAALCWAGHKPVLMIGMAVLAVGDVAAAWVGEGVRQPHRYNVGGDEKSLEGSAAMLVSSFLVILGSFYYLWSIQWIESSLQTALAGSLAGAVTATAAEGFSRAGSDNLTVPLSTALVVHLVWYGGRAEPLLWSLGFALFAAIVAYRFRFLNASGSVAAFLLGTVIFAIGGWSWAGPVLVFFVSSSLLSKSGQHRKAGFQEIFEKGSTRDAGQVLANGAVAGAVVIVNYFFPDEHWMPVFLGVVAAVAADTWATEIGIYFRHTPRSIVDGRRVEPGTSGGITVPGMLGALGGAALIAACGWMTIPAYTWRMAGWITSAGVAGSLIDSWVGATLQGQFECAGCGKSTERKVHCDAPTRRVRGWRALDNDKVNVACSLAGGILAAGWFWFA
jgi:uncharacterized protein (TIGR00297 family)